MLVLACGLVLSGIVAGTVALLFKLSGTVENVFVIGDVEVTLAESADLTLNMVPGWTTAKDPKVRVNADSDDCIVFVELSGTNAGITENDNGTYSLGEYALFALDSGWTPLAGYDNVYYRYVDDDTERDVDYSILAGGSWTDSMGTAEDTTDDYTVTWGPDQIATRPSVTREMMAALTDSTRPTLSFAAYAVQLQKTADVQFTPEEAWLLAKEGA